MALIRETLYFPLFITRCNIHFKLISFLKTSNDNHRYIYIYFCYFTCIGYNLKNIHILFYIKNIFRENKSTLFIKFLFKKKCQ